MVVFGQGGCFWAKVVVFGQKWLYSVKSGCNRANVVVYRKIDFIPAKWLYFGKVVVFWQSWLYSGKKGFIRRKWLYSGKSGYIRSKLDVFGKIGCFR